MLKKEKHDKELSYETNSHIYSGYNEKLNSENNKSRLNNHYSLAADEIIIIIIINL